MKTARIKVRLATSQYGAPITDGFTLILSDDGDVTERRFRTREQAQAWAEANGYTLRYSG